MNANELADKSFMGLWDAYTSKKMECEDLEEKLRQQQAEIDSLQKNLDVALMIVNEPAKTLTDEEIEKVKNSCRTEMKEWGNISFIDFARAILRKAQEK